MSNHTNPIENDLRTRWVPSPEQFAAAEALGVEICVPIALPGKEYGIWEFGQPVEHPKGAWTIHDDDDICAARDGACLAAAHHLGERPGTVGYAYVKPDGQTSFMFEDIIPPLRHLALSGG